MNILIGKIGKAIKFKNLKINTGDDSSMILFSTMARMLPEHNFYFCGPNDLKKLSTEEYNYIFPNGNVHSIYVNPNRPDPTDKDIMNWDSLTDHIKKLNLTFDFAILFTGYVGYHCLNLCCKRPDGKYYTPLNAFKRYCGPYVHVINTFNIPLYTIAEDPRYITINTEELFVRERLILTQMADCTVPVAQKYITSYEDHTHNIKTPIPCTYAGVEKIFLMGIDKNWRDNIDIEHKITNTKYPKCIVISNGHGTSGLNSGAVVKDGRLPGYLEYIVNGLKGTEYADTHVYGLWENATLEKYPYTFQDKKMIELADEIAAAKYSLVYSIVPDFITIKPYEMIIQGLVPFIHPDYDKNRILGLPEYVYVKNPEDFANKMRELDEDDSKYRSLIEECFNCIKPEYLDGSYLVNNIMQKIGNNLGFDYINHKGVESIFNHFGENVFDHTQFENNEK
jgi:hypothetical protein